MRVEVEQELCEGFGTCAAHDPDVFLLDEWGYARAAGDGAVPEGREGLARRAIRDCPAHAIIESAGPDS